MRKVADRIAVLGLGLIGGSLALAIRRGKLARRVCGYARREKTRKLALKMKAVDEVFKTPLEAVKNADMVVICVPVLATSALARRCLGGLKKGCVVTDAGSTKEHVTREMNKLLSRNGAVFVGSHPIAGSEETGLESARGGIFKGATVVVTVSHGKRMTAGAGKVVSLWKALGARVAIMTPDEHDRMLAGTSHLPHLAAVALVDTVLGAGGAERTGLFCGTGFRDATRVAGGSEDLWHDIVRTNARHVDRSLAEFRKRIDAMRCMIGRKRFEDLRKFLAESRKFRSGLR